MHRYLSVDCRGNCKWHEEKESTNLFQIIFIQIKKEKFYKKQIFSSPILENNRFLIFRSRNQRNFTITERKWPVRV